VADDWGMVLASRADLASLCDGLTDDQWNAETLCAGWKVRHVVAHVTDTAAGKVLPFLPVFVTSGYNVDRTILRMALKAGDGRSHNEAVSRLRENLESRKTPPGVPVAGILTDVVAHTQDITRPLGVPFAVPSDRVLASLDFIKTHKSFVRAMKSAAPVQFVATDVEWTHGEGAEARGTGEAILMAMCGRKHALADLDGPGVEVLRSRK
jgi:uncharacterized protein (TIGR03083 family)